MSNTALPMTNDVGHLAPLQLP